MTCPLCASDDLVCVNAYENACDWCGNCGATVDADGSVSRAEVVDALREVAEALDRAPQLLNCAPGPGRVAISVRIETLHAAREALRRARGT